MTRLITVLAFALIILAVGASAILAPKGGQTALYFRFEDGGAALNVIRTSPENIVLDTRLLAGGFPIGRYGINGGYYAPADSAFPGPLCIAVNDGAPVRPPGLRAGGQDPYQNTGWYNSWGNAGGAGTVVYDRVTGGLAVMTLGSGYDLRGAVSDPAACWAQGGIDFFLNDTDWPDKMRGQGLSDYLETAVTWRSAMGISGGSVYLITSDGECGLAGFRGAIGRLLGADGRAILLDGYKCSQMRAIKPDGSVFEATFDYPLEEIICLKIPG